MSEAVRKRKWWLLAMFGLALSGPLLAASGVGRSDAQPQLGEPARELLHTQMRQHAKHMTELTTAVVLLRRSEVAVLGAQIAEEPRVRRPVPGELNDLNAQIPEEFFALQDSFVATAGQLVTAAKQGDDRRLAQAYGQLASACVGCHHQFLPQTR